ncbi:MAG: YdcF family protein [Planctomycetes bacterium]|nr:YdcF family protein [Planctomycetota bacterium]
MTELLKSLANPIVWVLVFMVLSLILIIRPTKKLRFKLGKCALFLGICILFLLSIRPVSNLLIYYLECQYKLPSDEALSDLDMVVILGGGANIAGGFREHAEASGLTYARLFNGVRVYKQSGARTLALCGGYEAGVMKKLAIELGVQESEIITETRSGTTLENAAELVKLLRPAEQRRIGLVTSALHMLRSEKTFKKQFPNDTIVPIPVNYIYSPDWDDPEGFVPSTSALSKSNYAIHEWIGIVYYSIRY